MTLYKEFKIVFQADKLGDPDEGFKLEEAQVDGIQKR